ncbi:hypothetical protein CSC24_4865 (plasmid) [Escherichia coli]|nr:hypothetical protein CSC24_4865 [Escherichia coli]
MVRPLPDSTALSSPIIGAPWLDKPESVSWAGRKSLDIWLT